MSNRDRWKDYIEFQRWDEIESLRKQQAKEQRERLRVRRALRELQPQIPPPHRYFYAGLSLVLALALIAVWIFT